MTGAETRARCGFRSWHFLFIGVMGMSRHPQNRILCQPDQLVLNCSHTLRVTVITLPRKSQDPGPGICSLELGPRCQLPDPPCDPHTCVGSDFGLLSLLVTWTLSSIPYQDATPTSTEPA